MKGGGEGCERAGWGRGKILRLDAFLHDAPQCAFTLVGGGNS